MKNLKITEVGQKPNELLLPPLTQLQQVSTNGQSSLLYDFT